MVDLVAGEQLAQRAALHVGEGVIGHQPLRDDAMLGEEGQRPLEEAGHCRGFHVVVELDISEP